MQSPTNPTYQASAWDEGIYSQLPMDKIAFGHLAKTPVSEDAIEAIRNTFLRYNVERELALCVVHRHFDLNQAEQLVEFNNVIAPWRINDSPDYLQPGIRPKNWAFVNGRLFPYEFKFNGSVEPAPAYNFNPDFVGELFETLALYGLQDIYGLGALEPDDFDLTTPSKLEFTAGRTNVVVAFTKEMEAMARVEASWFFPCANPMNGPFDENGGVKTRLCNLQCRDHKGSDV